MKGQSFINFLKEQEGKADRQKVLALSALVGSSVLAQLMFVGTASTAPEDCWWTSPNCQPWNLDACVARSPGDCWLECLHGINGPGTCQPQ